MSQCQLPYAHVADCSSADLRRRCCAEFSCIDVFGAMVVDRLLLLLEQVLEDELAPDAAACVHQRAPFVELSQLDGCEPELSGQGRHGSDRVLVVTREKDDPVPAHED